MSYGTIPATPGTGLLFPTDNAGGVSTPIGKIAVGPAGTNNIVGDGSTTMPVSDSVVAGSLISILNAQATAAAQATAQTSLASILSALAVLVSDSPALVGGAVPVVQPTGYATSTLQGTGNTSLASILSALQAALPLPSGASTSSAQASQLTALGLLATASTQTSQSTTLNSIAASVATPALPTGAATQTTLASILSALQAALPLPTGASSAANQATIIADLVTALASLATISTNTAPVSAGQKTMAQSLSFASASDDSNFGPGTTTASNAITASGQNLFGPVNVLGMALASICLTTLGTGNTFTVMVSNDGTTYENASCVNAGLPQASPAQATFNSVGAYVVPLGFAWLKVVCSVYGSGSPVASMCLCPRPIQIPANYPLTVSPIPTTTQGSSHFSKFISTLVSAGAALSSQVSSTAVNLTKLIVSNNNASKLYLKIYNVASGLTVGTTVPVWTITLQPNTTYSLDCGPFSARLFTGFAISINSGSADTDNTLTCAAGDVIVNWLY